MPRMNAISTMAKDCSDEPKISASDREASNSNPIETPPVMATINPAQRKASGEAGICGVLSAIVAPDIATIGASQPVRFNNMAAAPMKILARGGDLQRGDHTVMLYQPESRQRRAGHRAEAVDRVKSCRAASGIGRECCSHAASKGSVPPIKIVGPSSNAALRTPFNTSSQPACSAMGVPSAIKILSVARSSGGKQKCVNPDADFQYAIDFDRLA